MRCIGKNLTLCPQPFLTRMKDESFCIDQCWASQLGDCIVWQKLLTSLSQTLYMWSDLAWWLYLFIPHSVVTDHISRSQHCQTVLTENFSLIWLSWESVGLLSPPSRSWIYQLDFRTYSREIIDILPHLEKQQVTLAFSSTPLKQNLSDFAWLWPCLGYTLSF